MSISYRQTCQQTGLRAARRTRLVQSDVGWALGVVEVGGIDEAQRPGLAVEQHRVGPCASVEEPDSVKDVAIGDTGGDEAEVVTGGQVLGAVDAVLVGDPHSAGARALL